MDTKVLEKINKELQKAEKNKLFGELVIKFKAGSIYQIIKNQSLKLEDLE